MDAKTRETALKSYNDKISHYERILLSHKAGVLNLTGDPGKAKSAIIEFIAMKNNYQFLDVRLGQIGDVGEILGIPRSVEINGVRVMSYDIPEWAWLANQKPTIVLFDEGNRAQQDIQNAVLQPLLERRLGYKYKFNDNVKFAFAGNMGDADGTNVEKFDNALNNRLVHIHHDLTLNEWIVGYAEANVNPFVIKFLEANEGLANRLPENEEPAYPSFRTWTMLSNLCGKNATVQEVMNIASEHAEEYVGAGAKTRFVSYLNNMIRVNLKDVLNRYPEVKGVVEEMDRSILSEIMSEIKAMDLSTLEKKQYVNLVEFLKVIHDDERTGYLNYLTMKYLVEKTASDNFKIPTKDENPALYSIRDAFKDTFVYILKNVNQVLETNK